MADFADSSTNIPADSDASVNPFFTAKLESLDVQITIQCLQSAMRVYLARKRMFAIKRSKRTKNPLNKELNEFL